MMDLCAYIIAEAPRTVHYIPNFVTDDEEKQLLESVYNVPKPKWTQLSNRRLQDYGGIPTKRGLIPEVIPSWLEKYMIRVSDLNIFATEDFQMKQANHCLINEYKPGQGIMSHFDGSVFTPVISTISLGTHTTLDFFQSEGGSKKIKCKLLLERKSLVILSNDMYKTYMHGITDRYKDVIDEKYVNINACGNPVNIGDLLERDTRVSLTIRNVPKVWKCKILKLSN